MLSARPQPFQNQDVSWDRSKYKCLKEFRGILHSPKRSLNVEFYELMINALFSLSDFFTKTKISRHEKYRI